MGLVLVTGAKGQLGTYLTYDLLAAGYKVLACSHDDLDVTDESELASLFEAVKPDLVVNLASFNDVEKAEEQSHLAYAVNALGAKYLSVLCAKYSVPLVHISSDYVYDSSRNSGHTEDEKLMTNCEFGKSKLYGERFIQESGCPYVIVRTSWLFSLTGENILTRLLHELKQKDHFCIFEHEISIPTPAKELSLALTQIAKNIIETDFTDYGIYNYASDKAVSYADFVKAVVDELYELKLLSHEVKVESTSIRDKERKALRPDNSSMDSRKISKTFNLTLPDWRVCLKDELGALLEC
ncbi:MAG: SDR family oxidoreductase [Succinivibrio sp.]